MLPKVGGSFEWVDLAPGPALVCRPLAAVAAHFFTTRGWSIGSGGRDDGSWSEVASAAGVASDHLVRLQQVHGVDIVVHRRGEMRDTSLRRADILLSDDPDLALAVQAADCVPLLLADERTGRVAAAHAGWRGLASRVPAVAVDALSREFGARPADLIAAAGPSIGACCYEVGEEVRRAFLDRFGDEQVARWFSHAPSHLDTNPAFRAFDLQPGRWFFDPWRAVRDGLEAAGVPADRIHVAALCTASHLDALCSYRREGAAAGRIAGVIRPSVLRPSQGSPAGRRARSARGARARTSRG